MRALVQRHAREGEYFLLPDYPSLTQLTSSFVFTHRKHGKRIARMYDQSERTLCELTDGRQGVFCDKLFSFLFSLSYSIFSFLFLLCLPRFTAIGTTQ